MLPSATDLFNLSRYRVVRSRLQRRRNVNLDSSLVIVMMLPVSTSSPNNLFKNVNDKTRISGISIVQD